MSRSQELFEQALYHIPGGVNSPVRAFHGVGGDPIFIDRAAGAYFYDPDGNRYIDYVGSWGPMVLGHAHPEVISAVQKVVQKGLSFGAPHSHRDRDGQQGLRAGAFSGSGTHGQLRHRGHHERHPPGPRLYRPG